MDGSDHHAQQFFTDENGVNYSRYGADAPWRQISPRRQPALHHAHPQAHQFSAAAPTFSFPPSNIGLPSIHNTPLPYNRDLAHPSSQPPPGIDSMPTSRPVMGNDEADPPPSQRLPQVARPAAKIAGVRRADPDPKGKGKAAGKRKATASSSADVKKQKGRVVGAANYTADDIWGLLAILSERLPIGGKAWNNCADEYNAWAEENDRPVRTSKSLEAKFKQLVKTTKPTGDAEMPDYVQQAHEIEDAINEKAGTRDLDDDDIADDVIEPSSDEEDAPAIAPPPKKLFLKKPVDGSDKGPVVRRATSDRITQSASHLSRPSRNSGTDFLTNISAALDPSMQTARQEERTARTFQASQMFSMSAQLRESQSLVESLRTRLAEADRERNAAERRADRAEVLSMISGTPAQQMPPPLAPPRWSNFPAPTRTPTRAVRHDVFYSDGGRNVRWVAPDDPEPLYPDSPGTRVFARYTPEHPATFSSHHTQHSPDRVVFPRLWMTLWAVM
ncbi:hypothetical protein GALMADRAFT_215218 [Galerina marginata CBS 339.88]|uniref:DUF6818 domain-containing protein n=1 Tax=Galerina marginata (strain CBS 339.88) TaxID=685588 RepID=A0A067SQX7_GALM3|nr:hypothetical protein GALMADRAFT_215218 [Galerina marginata CBS 339.88]